MTITKTSLAAGLSGLFLFVLAPAALAQDLSATGGLTDTVGGTTDTVTDTVGGTTGGTTDTVTDTVGGTTDPVKDTTGGTTDTVTDTVGGTTDTVTDTVGDTTGGTTDTVTDTVDDTTGGSGGDKLTGPVTDTVDGISGDGGSGSTDGGSGGSIGSVIDDLLDGGTGSTIPGLENLTPEEIDELIKEAEALGLSPAAVKGWIEGKKILTTSPYGTPAAALASLSEVFDDFATDVAGILTLDSEVRLSTGTEGESFFQAAGRVAAEGAKMMAFPLALALLVVGFLVVQGRIGRRDPKLVLAPVDSTEASLTFE